MTPTNAGMTLSTFMGDIEVFGLSGSIDYGNGGPGGFGGPSDHHGLEDMLRFHSSGGEAELTFHQLDMAVDEVKSAASKRCRTFTVMHTLKEPLRLNSSATSLQQTHVEESAFPACIRK